MAQELVAWLGLEWVSKLDLVLALVWALVLVLMLDLELGWELALE